MLRYLDEDVAVVVLSAQSDPSRVESMMNEGALGFVPKPCELGELLDQVGAAIALIHDVVEDPQTDVAVPTPRRKTVPLARRNTPQNVAKI